MRIKLDFSLIVALLLMEWYLVSVYIPTHLSSLSVIDQVTIVVSVNAILIVSLTIHELAHLVIACLLGIKIRQLIIFIFGGIYDTPINEAKDNNDYDSREQLKFALAGPLASAGLAALFALTWILEFQEVNPKEMFLVREAMSTFFMYAAIGNGLLALMNLIPLFPLDGGRIFYYIILKKRNESLCKTTQIKIGTLCSFGLLIAGVYFLFFYNFYIGIIFILLAWVLNIALREFSAMDNKVAQEFT